ncbi:MAG: hypothetical protein J0I20_14625 [Chloroflexi bacterium]|nr:hypothetical protein [Chloroflexota bacterium]OJW02735.1 MAG: hypothetical protein BGO39_05780 [Chloroflexi bacterium 54-19]
MFFKVVGRLTARLLRSIGKFFYTIFRNVGRHPVRSLFSFVFTVAFLVVFWLTGAFGLAGLFGNSNSPVLTAVEPTAQPEGKANDFLVALKDGKASGMYDALSDDYKNTLKSRGIKNATDMQNLVTKKLNEITGQPNGHLTYSFTFYQGVRYNDGSVENDFTGSYETAGNRTSVQVVMKLKDGKIFFVDATDPVILAAIGTGKDASGGDAQLGVVSNNRSPVAEDFMKGLTTFDVNKIWDNLADSYKTELTNRGVTKDTMSKVFDQVKTINASKTKNSVTYTYDGYAYLDTINFPNGITVNEFVSILSISDAPTQPRYSIVLDANQKIIRLGNDSAQDPIFTNILGRNSQGQGQ